MLLYRYTTDIKSAPSRQSTLAFISVIVFPVVVHTSILGGSCFLDPVGEMTHKVKEEVTLGNTDHCTNTHMESLRVNMIVMHIKALAD